MYRLLFISIIVFTSFNYSTQRKAKELADTLEKLRKLADFKPLNTDEAYAFLKRYYLPHLDTMLTKRKIFIYPLSGKDFNRIFNEAKARLTAQYNGDTLVKKRPNEVIFAPPPLFF